MRSSPALLYLFLLTSFGRAQEFQSWNEVDVTASWSKADVLVPTLVRIDSHLPNPQLAATGVIADFSLSPHLMLTGGYLFADLPQRSLAVHVPLVAVHLSFRAHRFTFIDRNRFEKLVGFGTSPVRYRNRGLLDRPFGADDRWHAFVDDEAFVDLSAAQWSQNRFQAGGGARVGPRSILDVYYLRRTPSGAAPSTNATGVTLTIELKKKRKL